jgi:hypothetical protein
MGWFWGKRFHFGSRTDDRITGSSRSDIVFGFGGDDEISTRGGRDRIFAGRGDDTIHAGTGNDFVAAGQGDDLIFDGAGSDTVTAGRGDDTVVFVARDNIGYHDRFDGGRGQDTLRLELTSQDWTADVREEVQAFLEFVAANTRIVSIAPSDDTDLVNLDRKISVRFDRPVDPRTITSDSFQILAPDGAQIEGALRLSSDGLKASFFLAEGSLLPASSTVRILIDGTQILDTAGQPVDADGDGIAGGTASPISKPSRSRPCRTPISRVSSSTATGVDRTARIFHSKGLWFRLSACPGSLRSPTHPVAYSSRICRCRIRFSNSMPRLSRRRRAFATAR